MSTEAIVTLVVALLIVWGGLALSIIALTRRPERATFPPGGDDDHREDDAIIEHDT
jgi:hypothetical protein